MHDENPTHPRPAYFWARVDVTEDCWLWRGSINAGGYGLAYISRPDVRGCRLAHRISYEMHVGPIPAGLVLDHLCRVRNCVNPEHLEPVTIGENVLRGETLPAQNLAKTHCNRGHEYTPENTVRWSAYDGRSSCRICRTCRSEYKRAYDAARKEERRIYDAARWAAKRRQQLGEVS